MVRGDIVARFASANIFKVPIGEWEYSADIFSICLSIALVVECGSLGLKGPVLSILLISLLDDPINFVNSDAKERISFFLNIAVKPSSPNLADIKSLIGRSQILVRNVSTVVNSGMMG